MAEAIREVASETILFELQDPRIKNVTVTRAEVSGDLQHAKVYVSVMGTEKEQDLCMHGLSTGRLRAVEARRPACKTRFTPDRHVRPDEGVKKSIEMTRLINEALAQSRPRPAAHADEGQPGIGGRMSRAAGGPAEAPRLRGTDPRGNWPVN